MPPASKIRFRGAACALAAALLWGLVPLYIDIVDATNPYEIVAHRALWSGVLLLFFMLITGGVRMVPGVIADGATRRGFVVSSFLLTVNWGLFVYAVQAGHAIEAALGYFIYPLVAVVLGILLLGERLDRLGWVAVGIVVCGVLAKMGLDGRPPIIGLCLAVTFGLYGVTRKRMGIDPVMGMFVETLVVMPLAAGYLIWMAHDGQPVFYGGGFFNILLALFAGVITVVPLLLYHAGNRDLPFAMASLLFYANPTTQLCLGVFVFGGAFTLGDGLTFGLIWTGIIVYFTSRPKARPVSTVCPPPTEQTR
jgi:chloramphenicol-sensitive protein RarD